ncbi:hypothetical protein [Deinococcus sp. ME38]|uniref:hypothetical protein n=1 Tax=Deinococcus sp. ME38 TaxID=3400344 RepID=UPI003B5917A2
MTTFIAPPQITPEQEDILLAHIDAHGPTPAATFEDLLGVTKSHMQRFLEDLADRGLIRSERQQHRLVWMRVTVTLNEKLVRPEFEARILAALTGRRDTALALARQLNLPVDEVAATCQSMALRGQLSVTSVLNMHIYSVGPRIVTHVDAARAASIPMSPEARFQAQLAKLPPERRLPVTRPAVIPAAPVSPPPPGPQTQRAPQARPVTPPPAPKPPRTDGLRRIPEAAAELGVKVPTFYKWLHRNAEARALCTTEDGTLLIPEVVLQRYITAMLVDGATWSATVPDGWLDIWAAEERLGWNRSKIYQDLAKGRLVAVQADAQTWFDPASLDQRRAELTKEDPPEGWLPLRTLCEELSLHPSSVRDWLKRAGYELRTYRDAQRQLSLHVPVAGADAYRGYRATTPGGRRVTPQVVAGILADLPALEPGTRRTPGLIDEVATQYGLSRGSVEAVLKQHGHAGTRRPPISVEVEAKARELLPSSKRWTRGETVRVAEQFGVSPDQIYRALRKIPVQQQ